MRDYSEPALLETGTNLPSAKGLGLRVRLGGSRKRKKEVMSDDTHALNVAIYGGKFDLNGVNPKLSSAPGTQQGITDAVMLAAEKAHNQDIQNGNAPGVRIVNVDGAPMLERTPYDPMAKPVGTLVTDADLDSMRLQSIIQEMRADNPTADQKDILKAATEVLAELKAQENLANRQMVLNGHSVPADVYNGECQSVGCKTPVNSGSTVSRPAKPKGGFLNRNKAVQVNERQTIAVCLFHSINIREITWP